MKKNKVILINANTSFSIYNFRLGLIKELKDNGFEIYVSAPYDNYSDLLMKECNYI